MILGLPAFFHSLNLLCHHLHVWIILKRKCENWIDGTLGRTDWSSISHPSIIREDPVLSHHDRSLVSADGWLYLFRMVQKLWQGLIAKVGTVVDIIFFYVLNILNSMHWSFNSTLKIVDELVGKIQWSHSVMSHDIMHGSCVEVVLFDELSPPPPKVFLPPGSRWNPLWKLHVS